MREYYVRKQGFHICRKRNTVRTNDLALGHGLQKLDTENVEPTTYILPIYNAFREDVAVEGVTQEVALKDAPAVYNGGFKVPRVME